jgi:hypothetical protein
VKSEGKIHSKWKVIQGNLGPNWRQLDSNVTRKEIGTIKDISPIQAKLEAIPGNCHGRLFLMLKLGEVFVYSFHQCSLLRLLLDLSGDFLDLLLEQRSDLRPLLNRS